MIHRKYLFTLMQSLLYPAMLGTFFVLFFQYFIYGKNQIWTFQFSYYIFVLFYFVVSFLINETLRKDNSYNTITFFVDFLELVVMFFLFSILTDKDETNLGRFYKTLSFLPICQIIWNFSVGAYEKKYIILNVSVFIIDILWGFYFYKYFALNVIVFVIYLTIMIYYLKVLLYDDQEFSVET